MNNLQEKIYQSLCSRSRRAIKKKKKKFGKPYFYNPRGDLLQRLSKQFGLTIDKVYNELMEIHYELTGEDYYY